MFTGLGSRLLPILLYSFLFYSSSWCSLLIPQTELAAGIPILDLLVRAGLAASKSEARRLVQGKGAKLNDATVEDDTLRVTEAALSPDGTLKLTAGKKRHALVKLG